MFLFIIHEKAFNILALIIDEFDKHERGDCSYWHLWVVSKCIYRVFYLEMVVVLPFKILNNCPITTPMRASRGRAQKCSNWTQKVAEPPGYERRRPGQLSRIE